METGYDYQYDEQNAVAALSRFMIVTESGRMCLCGHGHWLDKPYLSNSDRKLPGLLPSFFSCRIWGLLLGWGSAARLLTLTANDHIH